MGNRRSGEQLRDMGRFTRCHATPSVASAGYTTAIHRIRQDIRNPHPRPFSLAATREKGAEGGLRDDGVHLREQK